MQSMIEYIDHIYSVSILINYIVLIQHLYYIAKSTILDSCSFFFFRSPSFYPIDCLSVINKIVLSAKTL
jgi:hypothetical protein